MNPRKSGEFYRVLHSSLSSMGLEYLYLFFISAIYCTSGEQAAKRAKEGFDMVSSFLF